MIGPTSAPISELWLQIEANIQDTGEAYMNGGRKMSPRNRASNEIMSIKFMTCNSALRKRRIRQCTVLVHSHHHLGNRMMQLQYMTLVFPVFQCTQKRTTSTYFDFIVLRLLLGETAIQPLLSTHSPSDIFFQCGGQKLPQNKTTQRTRVDA